MTSYDLSPTSVAYEKIIILFANRSALNNVLIGIETVGDNRVEVLQTCLLGKHHCTETEQVCQAPENNAPRLLIVAAGSTTFLLTCQRLSIRNNGMSCAAEGGTGGQPFTW